MKSSNGGSVSGSFPYKLHASPQVSCRIRQLANGWVNASCFACQCIWLRSQHACQWISRSKCICPLIKGFKLWRLLIITLKWFDFSTSHSLVTKTSTAEGGQMHSPPHARLFWKEAFLSVNASLILTRVLIINDIKNNAWVTVNNDFWVTSEAICQ